MARMAARGRVSYNRLTRDEYVNTVRDLIGVHFDATDPGGFLEDPEWRGFERLGSVLTLSPSNIEKYLTAAETVLAEAYPARFGVSPKLRALVAAGKTGIYRPDFTIDESVAALLAGGTTPQDPPGPPSGGTHPPRPPLGGMPSPQTPLAADEVRERALEALAEEIRRMLDEGVVAAPEDIDLCMILGAGWPFHLGGITPYLDRTGIAEKVTGTRFRP